MAKAFDLAEKGLGYTSPNPPVGAMLLKGGRIIATGYHKKAGLPHAEIEAINRAGKKARGATLITTLEPCSHHGKTPPCVDAIIAAGVKKVVGAITDKNPEVSGRGYRKLRRAGIEVVNGVLRKRAQRFYEPYFKFITTGIPFVTLKFAQSIDGRIATLNGNSHWISSPESLKLSHQLRAITDSVLIGNGTLKSDDPKLTTRLVKGPNPIRILLSGSGKITGRSMMLTDRAAPTYVATAAESNLRENRDFIIIRVRKLGSGLDLEDLLSKLGKMGVVTLLVEGGSQVLTSFIKQKIADRIIVCIAPMIIGDGIPAIGDLGVAAIENSIALSETEWFKSGPDLFISGKPIWR
jgi:diaminohydroxyphosphoribosylaminopyrimidine deaminase/5-amino-6-(5-phosphoribosylamino)uracil reductase